jgi:hypothetical protein
VMAGVLRILSRKHENKLREKGMGKLARGCASNQEMSSTKSGNESTHARKALKECSGFITSTLVAYVSFSWNLLDTLLPRGSETQSRLPGSYRRIMRLSPSMKAGMSQVRFSLFLFALSVFSFPPVDSLHSSQAASVAILPSALLVERFSLGAWWAFPIQ